MSNPREFLQDADGAYSMMRLLMIMSFLPATYIACSIRTTEALGVYIGAYVGGYANSKWAERRKANVIPISSQSKAD